MSGEALQIADSLIRELSAQGFEIDHESVDPFTREGEKKVSAIQASQLSGTLLRDPASRVPVNRCREPELVGQLMRRAPQGSEDLCR